MIRETTRGKRRRARTHAAEYDKANDTRPIWTPLTKAMPTVRPNPSVCAICSPKRMLNVYARMMVGERSGAHSLVDRGDGVAKHKSRPIGQKVWQPHQKHNHGTHENQRPTNPLAAKMQTPVLRPVEELAPERRMKRKGVHKYETPHERSGNNIYETERRHEVLRRKTGVRVVIGYDDMPTHHHRCGKQDRIRDQQQALDRTKPHRRKGGAAVRPRPQSQAKKHQLRDRGRTPLQITRSRYRCEEQRKADAPDKKHVLTG